MENLDVIKKKLKSLKLFVNFNGGCNEQIIHV